MSMSMILRWYLSLEDHGSGAFLLEEPPEAAAAYPSDEAAVACTELARAEEGIG